MKENFTLDPSSSAMNYVKFTAITVASIALKQNLTDKKILPDNMKSPDGGCEARPAIKKIFAA